jgi:hypothetical protein
MALVAGSTVVAALGLAGCSDDGGVASLEGAAATGTAGTGSGETAGGSGGDGELTAAEQEANTQAMVDCLVEAGVPAMILPGEVNGVTRYELAFDGQMVSRRDPASGGGTGAVTQMVGAGSAVVDADKHARVFEAVEGDYALVIDAVDYSADYERCYVDTGYTPLELVPEIDPAEELKAKQAEAEVSNEWAACARQNGWPDVADADPPVADGYETYPTVVVPGSITVDQLDALLDVCPVFDEEAYLQALEDMAAQVEEDGPVLDSDGEADFHISSGGGGGTSLSVGGQQIITPSISFDLPGFDQYGQPIGEVSAEDQAHLAELTDKLWEDFNAFMQTQGAGTSLGGTVTTE